MSELYASMLMIGVTLSVGSFVAYAAVSQAGAASGSASLGAALAQSSAGTQLSLVYAAVTPSASCPTYAGYHEGTSLSLSLYDYGTASFSPAAIMVNSTVYPGSYATISAGDLATYTIPLATCAHSSGLTIFAVDPSGGEVQVGT